MNATAKVFVQGNEYRSCTQRVFKYPSGGQNYDIVYDLPSADIVVWTGGADINPQIYGQRPHVSTYYSDDRDKRDLAAVEEALKGHKFLVGICRGAQLLNCIPNGGILWQNVDKHEYGVHTICDLKTQEWFEVNSYHHQMMRVTDKAELLAYAMESTTREDYGHVWHAPPSNVWTEKDGDPEAVFYPETRSLCLQFHPEFGHDPTTNYFYDLMDRLFWRD